MITAYIKNIDTVCSGMWNQCFFPKPVLSTLDLHGVLCRREHYLLIEIPNPKGTIISGFVNTSVFNLQNNYI